MPETPTPGEKAYEAYAAVMVPLAPWGTPDFAQLPDIHQRAWDAAAQAVRQDTPRFQFTLGQHVRRTGDAAQRWEIWYRTCREEVDRTFIDYGLRLVDPEAAYHPCRMSDGSDLVPAEEEPHG